jgi:hypothetical protein
MDRVPGAGRLAKTQWLTLGLIHVIAGLALAGAQEEPSEAELWGTGPGVFNHPVRVEPPATMTIPKDWPTDANGAITCLT